MRNPTTHSTAAIPAELQLLAACCDTPVTHESAARIEHLVAKVADWKAIDRCAARQQVQGFVQDRIGGLDTIAPEVREKWKNEVRRAARINLQQAHTTRALHAFLNDNGVPNLVLKGLPLSLQLYGSLTIKRSCDIDLLVTSDRAWDAIQLLAERGFTPIEAGKPLSIKQAASVVRHFKEITLVGDKNMLVDLHWRMIENSEILAGIDAFADSASVAIANLGEVAVLGEADAFAYLCAHGALSDWSRLKWLVDVNALLAGRSDSEIENLYAHAESLGAGPCALQALGLREIFWSKPIPQSLRKALASIDQPDFLGFPLDRMLQPYKPPSSRDTVRRIARQTKVRAALYSSSFNAFTENGAHMRALPDVLALPLPPALDWLYYPLRPVFWLMRKLRS